MKKLVLALSACAIVSYAGEAMSQCLSSTTTVSAACASNSCKSSVTFVTPVGDEGDVAAQSSPVYCCSQMIGVSVAPTGGYCEYAKLKDPAVRQHLLEMASSTGEPFLVANCDGEFVPLTARDSFALKEPNLIPNL